jgi:hypothetical protein
MYDPAMTKEREQALRKDMSDRISEITRAILLHVDQ